ncbi:hypothetical protein SCLCIDRAFT_27891 [Scleroderma citrinum Foug A]|uniref:Sensitive to high expression protein 9, mitochondrial n=1 Tax=Scleroderma citrinum Foug A TaxID=1036808 RepID=A0A0C3DRM5_9AGAM|nr:hypothetical protein SCLCIDRAFT_27891 [Scleroderma citrinum Foug A]
MPDGAVFHVATPLSRRLQSPDNSLDIVLRAIYIIAVPPLRNLHDDFQASVPLSSPAHKTPLSSPEDTPTLLSSKFRRLTITLSCTAFVSVYDSHPTDTYDVDSASAGTKLEQFKLFEREGRAFYQGPASKEVDGVEDHQEGIASPRSRESQAPLQCADRRPTLCRFAYAENFAQHLNGATGHDAISLLKRRVMERSVPLLLSTLSLLPFAKIKAAWQAVRGAKFAYDEAVSISRAAVQHDVNELQQHTSRWIMRTSRRHNPRQPSQHSRIHIAECIHACHNGTLSWEAGV